MRHLRLTKRQMIDVRNAIEYGTRDRMELLSAYRNRTGEYMRGYSKFVKYTEAQIQRWYKLRQLLERGEV